VEWGDDEAYLRELAAEGEEVSALLDKPGLLPDLVQTWQYFQLLNRSRGANFSPQPFTFSDIRAFLEMCQVPIHRQLEIALYISELDAEWRLWHYHKNKDK
jgi:hypothetical protein